jgi:ABC-type Mn2+/Zn2+ transport system permease subunit
MNFLDLTFMRVALAAGLLAGTALSVIGVFTVARRVAFSGLAAAQWAALGGVIGALAGFHVGAGVVSGGAVVAGLLAMAWLSRSRRTSADSWVAALYVLGAASAVLLLSKSPRGESETLGVFFGNILSLGRFELIEAGAVCAAALAGTALWFRRWLWLSFDPVGAEVAGVRVGVWNALFYGLYAASLTLSIHVFGVLLSFAYLILPATTGLLLSRRPRSLILVCVGTSVLSTVVGFALSYRWDLPTGPFVALVLAGTSLGARIYGRIKGDE